MKRYCFIDGCDKELGPRQKSDICTTCQHGLRYWDGRDHADVIERQRKLGMWQARMSTISGKRRRSSAVARSARGADARASQ